MSKPAQEKSRPPRRWPRWAAHVITGLTVFGGVSLWWLIFGWRMLLGPSNGTVYEWADWWLGAAVVALLVPLLVVPPVLIVGFVLGRGLWLLWGLFNLAVALGALITTWQVLDAEQRAWERERIEAPSRSPDRPPAASSQAVPQDPRP